MFLFRRELGSRYRLGSFYAAAANKHREEAEQLLFPGGEQLVAPVQGIAQRLLSQGQIPRPVRQHLQGILQARKQLLGREEFNARRRKFNGQWKPIEPKTDRSDGCCITLGESETRGAGLGALVEERDGRILGERFMRRHVLEIRECQGRDLELVLALHL